MPPARVATGRPFSASTDSYSPERRISTFCRSVSMLPPGSSTCFLRIAADTSEAVRPRASSRAGSSQTRISRFLRPGVSTLPTPSTDWKRATATLSTKTALSL